MKYEYLTSSKGIGGKIKEEPEDFIVEEVYDRGVCSIDYKLNERLRDMLPSFKKREEQTQFILVKRNYNTFRAINLIAKKLRVSRKRFGVAGNKDKVAVTAQRVSVWNTLISKLKRVKIRELILKNFEYSNKRIQTGDLLGNRFTIKIKNIELKKGEIEKRINEFATQIEKGLPNFFGPQRFGVRRNVNHIIGEKLALGRIEDGVRIFLVESGNESREAIEARSFLRNNWGTFSEAIKLYPKYLGLEKAILNSLIKEKNFVRSLRVIPVSIRKLFVHAYQAYLFNKKLNNLIRNRRVPKEILLSPMEVEGMKELTCKGIYRKSLFTPEDFKIVKIDDSSVTISFFLQKGSYATILLNELMKTDSTKGHI
jgi:tRNA pseudouridine13 synthase